MEILVIGNKENLYECRQKFGESHLYQMAKNFSQMEMPVGKDCVVFDFQAQNSGALGEIYKHFRIVFLDVSRSPLADFVDSNSAGTTFFGFCGLPTFFNRDLLEVSLLRRSDEAILNGICENLGTKFAVVKDQVGLVTPRVVCMIINEAYFAVQENIAARDDIDLAMRLGTNYPFGPFEWCDKIGIRNVYEVLEAVHNSAEDMRYEVCELLKQEALSSKFDVMG